MDRRTFIALTAVTGSSAALTSCGNPENQLIRFIPDEDLVPGVAEWKPSLCPLCRAGCGTIVRVMEGEAEVVRGNQTGLVKMGLARKLEGNPAHPIDQGTLCPRGQAAIQLTYHPNRITQPLKRSGDRGSGQFQPLSWDEAVADLVSRLDMLAASGAGKSLAFLARPGSSVRHDLIATFLARFGAPAAASFEIFGDDVLRRANLLSFGREQLPTFNLARARYVIAFGADFLGTWNSPVAQTAAYGQMRQGRPGVRGKFVQVESRMSLTGASADEWVPARPGTEGVLALGLAHVILANRLRPADAAGRAGSLIDGWSGGLASYTPEEVEKRTGVSAARVERLARELVDGAPAVAIVGGTPLAQTNGLFQALAVNALNALLGSVGVPGGLQFMPEVAQPARQATAGRTLPALATEILGAADSPVQLLLVDDSNPVFSTPSEWKVRDALMKVPFIVSFGSFLDETSVLADLVLPDHSFLERWNDARPESGALSGVATLAPPAMRPLHQTRAMTDVLLDVAGQLKKPLTPAMPWKTFEEMLQASFATFAVAPATGDEVWEQAKMQGGWWGQEGRSTKVEGRSEGRSEGRREEVRSQAAAGGQTVPARLADAQFDGDPAQYPFYFFPYASQALLDGSLAHLPWLQELPDPISTAMWSSWIEINPQTAARLQIAEGDIVEVASSRGTLRAPALVSPGIAPDVIAMPAGQGHETFTRYASGRGANPIKILAPMLEPETGSLAWAATRVRVTRVGESDGSLILFAGAKTERPFGDQR